MKLIPVDNIPEIRHRGNNRLQAMIEEFVNSPYEVVKCQFDEGEYKSSKVCASVLRIAVKCSRYSIKVIKRGDDIYLSK